MLDLQIQFQLTSLSHSQSQLREVRVFQTQQLLYWCLLKDLCLQACKLFIGPGTVATWCKPSIGAGVVWANGAWVVGLGQARSLEKGSSQCGVPMQTLHHSATTPGICRKNKARRVACGAQGRGFDSLRGRRLFRLQSCYNVMPILCLLCNNHCKKVAFYLIGNCSGLFSSEIKASRQILKKSIESVKGNLPRGSHQH